MMHTICKYADNTELVISDIIKRENGEEIIKVVFERPTEHGFDTLIFELPSYKIVENDGNYTDEEIEIFKKVVEQGAAHFYEKVAGAISFSKYKNKNYIEAVAVDKLYRKKGYGRKLLDKAIDEMGAPVYAISKHDKFYLDYGFQYDDAYLIDNECKTCSEYNITCFPRVMVFTK